MGADDAAGSSSPASEATLTELDTDRWLALLPHVRAVVAEGAEGVEAEGDAALTALCQLPTTRLVGGRRRRELARRLASDPALWTAVTARIAAMDEVPEPLAWVLEPAPQRPSVPGHDPAGEQLRRDLDRARERLRAVREDRDRWRRRAEGTQARLDATTEALTATSARLAELEDQLAVARDALRRAAADRDKAVDRERRRQDAELTRLRDELAAVRRAEEQRRQARRREQDARDQAAKAARDAEASARRAASEQGRTQVVPGRPTRLPEGVAPDTTEAARLLLHPGRRVLVDGYNVSLQHRKHLELEQQRAWLVQLLGTLVAQRRIVPLVVFDGRAAGGARPPSARGVEVRFTAAGISADDELVLAVEGTDEPVVVVTDDRELRTRVQLGGADVVGTRSLLGVV